MEIGLVPIPSIVSIPSDRGANCAGLHGFWESNGGRESAGGNDLEEGPADGRSRTCAATVETSVLSECSNVAMFA